MVPRNAGSLLAPLHIISRDGLLMSGIFLKKTYLVVCLEGKIRVVTIDPNPKVTS